MAGHCRSDIATIPRTTTLFLAVSLSERNTVRAVHILRGCLTIFRIAFGGHLESMQIGQVFVAHRLKRPFYLARAQSIDSTQLGGYRYSIG